MRVIGLGYDGFHDSSVAVMDMSGQVKLAVSEERFSGVKKDGRFPLNAISKVKPEKGDILCISTQNDHQVYKSFEKAGTKITDTLYKERTKTLVHIKKFAALFDEVHWFSHHDCHAASAYYFSGFSDAIIITWDAGNNSEPWNMTAWQGNGTNISRIEQSFDALPALDYAVITALLGFKPGWHEGKVTGLSGCVSAKPEDIAELRQLLIPPKGHTSLFGALAKWQNVGSEIIPPSIVLDNYKLKHLHKKLTLSRKTTASAIQKITESRVLSVVKRLRRKYSNSHICLAGGLFANVLINRAILRCGYKKIYIHPAMGDDGLALGACSRYLGKIGVQPKSLQTSFFGPKEASIISIENELKKNDLKYEKPKGIAERVAEALAAGQIVAVCRGRMEYGPRALGHRSILAPATSSKINSTLNILLKRNEFMPFAPMTLEEDAADTYYELEGSLLAAKFMTIAMKCKQHAVDTVPAIVHIDGTARPLIVGGENPFIQNILRVYKKLTGISTLINTSFNIHEKPIVATPKDAIAAFIESDISKLVLGPFLVSQK